MIDIFDKCNTDGGYFGRFRKANDRFFTLPELEPSPGPHMSFQGQDNIMWSINNYIGLAGDKEIKEAALKAVEEYSVSSPMGSRMMSGSTSFHSDLEQSLAAHAQKEKAFLFNYGYMGVVGTVTALAGPDDVLVMDKLAHACIVDSAFSSQATVRVFRHNDMNDLESVLKSVNKNRKGGVMILVEGVYGMTGDLADLRGIVELKEKYNARIFIDDAHGIGVMGNQGRGTADHLGVQDKIDIYFGTFAKAFASIGGYSAASPEVRDWIAYNARTQVFAKALPMVYVRSLQTALQKVIQGDDRRARMWERSNQLKSGLRNIGYHVGTGDSPICAVFLPIRGEVETIAMEALTYLRQNSVFCSGISYPVIPRGLVMFRMIPTASHSPEDAVRTVEVFKSMHKDLKIPKELSDQEREKVNRIYRKS